MSLARLLDAGAHPIIGHRGASGLAPENTIASFDLALSQGAEAVELDVRLSRDGVPVVIHDALVDRTTDGSGPVDRLTVAELGRLDAGARFSADRGGTFPFRGTGVGVPTLREVLDRFRELPLLIELKSPQVANPVHDELLESGAAERVVVASFHDEAMRPFRSPPFHAGASRRDIIALVARATLGLAGPARTPELYAVPIRYKDRVPVPTRRFVAAAARATRPVHVWTVNDVPTAEELWDRGCAGMITNFPGLLCEARNRRFGA